MSVDHWSERRRTELTNLIVAVHSKLVSINASWPGVRRVIHEHPVHSLALVKVEPYLSTMAGNALLGALQTNLGSCDLHTLQLPQILLNMRAPWELQH